VQPPPAGGDPALLSRFSCAQFPVSLSPKYVEPGRRNRCLVLSVDLGFEGGCLSFSRSDAGKDGASALEDSFRVALRLDPIRFSSLSSSSMLPSAVFLVLPVLVFEDFGLDARRDAFGSTSARGLFGRGIAANSGKYSWMVGRRIAVVGDRSVVLISVCDWCRWGARLKTSSIFSRGVPIR
jgi:hypothetical protein